MHINMIYNFIKNHWFWCGWYRCAVWFMVHLQFFEFAASENQILNW